MEDPVSIGDEIEIGDPVFYRIIRQGFLSFPSLLPRWEKDRMRVKTRGV
jgi:hypothetical protein